MEKNINSTVFGTFFDDVDAITKRYANLTLENSLFKKTHLNSVSAFRNYSLIVTEENKRVYSTMTKLSIRFLVERIEIGSLNSLYQLGNSLSKQYLSSYNAFR